MPDEGIMGLLVQIFSVIGGIYMVIKVIDSYLTLLFFGSSSNQEEHKYDIVSNPDRTAERNTDEKGESGSPKIRSTAFEFEVATDDDKHENDDGPTLV